MSSSDEVAAYAEKYIGKTNELPTRLIEKVEQLTAQTASVAATIKCAEHRQCDQYGQSTDGARFLELWSLGENASLSNEVAENAIQRMCRTRGS